MFQNITMNWIVMARTFQVRLAIFLLGGIGLVGIPEVANGQTMIWYENQHLFAPDSEEADTFGRSVSVSSTPGIPSRQVAIVGANKDDTAGGIDAGSAHVYRLMDSVWVEEAHLFASDGAAGDRFGRSVSISGTPGIPGNEVAISGSNLDDTAGGTDAGSAYIYRFSGVNWVEDGHLFASDGAMGDEFGGAVSVCNNVVIVGAPGDDTGGGIDAGSVYFYRFDGKIWVEEGHHFASGGAAGDRFGKSVSISSTPGIPGSEVAIVGSNLDDTAGGTDAGSAFVYRYNGTNWVEEGHLFASEGADYDRFGQSVSISGAPGIRGSEVAIVGASWDDTSAGVDAGSAYVYRFDGVSWVEEEHLFASDGQGAVYPQFGGGRDLFGWSVSIDGDIAVVGSVWDKTMGGFHTGSAYVYHLRGTNWVQEKHLFASDGIGTDYFGSFTGGDQFGYSVSISGEIAIVAANLDNSTSRPDAGSVYVFDVSDLAPPAIQIEDHQLFASDGEGGNVGSNELGDYFGWSVSISGDVAIVGAILDDTAAGFQAGSAYIYRFNGEQWVEEEHLFASDGEGGSSPEGIANSDKYGFAVSISGTPGSEVAIVGAMEDNTMAGLDAGSAYIYRFNGVNWVEEGHLFASDGGNYHNFGVSVSISGVPGSEVAIVGAQKEDTAAGISAGSAYVYRFDGTTWVEEGHLFASDGAAGDSFGVSVSINGTPGNEVAIVGSGGHSTDQGENAGTAYLFRFDGVSWGEEAQLIASDGAANDIFGWKVSVSGTTGSEVAIVGAYLDDTASGVDAGSAYIYSNDGTNWVEEGHLFASDGSGGDQFGDSVSISGGVAMVGTEKYDTPSGSNAGSAYVYRLSGSNWMDEGRLFASDGTNFARFGVSVSVSGDPGNEVAIVGSRSWGDCSAFDECGIGSAYIFNIPEQPVICRGDISPVGGDGVVDIFDLMLVLNSFGACPLLPASCDADITPLGPPVGNGMVNIDDLVAVLNAFGACPF